MLREVVESASLDIFRTAPDDAALRGDIGFCQRPFTASGIVGFSDSMSISEKQGINHKRFLELHQEGIWEEK